MDQKTRLNIGILLNISSIPFNIVSIFCSLGFMPDIKPYGIYFLATGLSLLIIGYCIRNWKWYL